MKAKKTDAVDNVQDIAKISIAVGLIFATGTIVPWLKWANIAVSTVNRTLKMTGILKNNISTDTLIREEQKSALIVAWQATFKRIDTDTQNKLCDWIEGWLKHELSNMDSYSEEDVTKTFESRINRNILLDNI